jgi:hypothetical protein
MDVEQTETTTETTTTAEPSLRDELIAAVRDAGGTQAVDVAAEEQAAKERAAAAGVATEQPAEPAPEDPEAKFEAILAKRRENHQEISGAKARAERMLREAEEAKQRMIEEAKAEARRAAEEERERLRLNFRKSPTETLRALDEDPDYVADTVLAEGTPEARLRAKQREELEATKALAKKGEAALAEIEKFRKEQAAERQAAMQAQVRNEYLSQFATPEKTPYLHARYEPEEIFQRSVALAHQWAQEGLEYKKDFDDNTIAEYLEHQSKKRIAALNGTPANQVPAGAPAKGPGLATKVTANAPRTLSAAAGSERRTSPRPLHELTPEEQRKALIEEVAAARKANPDATS